MDELRLILLGAGVVIIALIYLWGMRKQIKARIERRRRRRDAQLPENEPVLEVAVEESADTLDREQHQENIEPSADAGETMEADETAVSEADQVDVSIDEVVAKSGRREHIDPEIAEAPQMTVLLTVVAPKQKQFKGISILEAAEAASLRLSRSGTLDCLAETAVGPRCVFRVGHLKEPGIFDLETVEGLETSGLLLFMHLPGPVDALAAVDLQLRIAARLAGRLGGTMCDERRNKMTTQAMIRLRSEAAEFERRLRVWAQQPRD